MLSLTYILAVLVFITNCNADRPIVEISTGTLIGTVEEFSSEFVDGSTRTVHVYRGIPYAEPPVGGLRFAPPKPKTPWQGEYDATDFRTACIQPDSPGIPIDKIQDEDCLHINVYVPQPRKANTPVMFWIHGGGFNVGSGTRMYDSTILSSLNDVIVVTINYRVGPLGFLSTGDDVASGNYGFLDQVEALRWVQQNIAAFGGDPDTVTIFGESAGAALQQCPGLFLSDASKTNKIAHGQGKLVGCEKDNSKELIECLRTVPADKFRDVSDVTKVVFDIGTLVPFTPTIDGHFIHEDPMELIAKKAFNSEELMIGKKQAVLDTIKLIYVDWDHADEENANYLSALSQMAGDMIMVCPTDIAARAHYAAGLATYLYQMTHVPAKSLWPINSNTAKHGDDISFTFGYTLLSEKQLALGGDETTIYKQTPNKDDIHVTLKMMKYWTNFAKTG
uniref:Carboxylic ester hydrolase n=1 Tax=Saccoglossus kowalevskii TaxID=10224 RepID=A0ABM0MJH9_SACKO